MTNKAAILAAAIIGTCILGSQLVAPYRAFVEGDGLRRINTITGAIEMCIPKGNGVTPQGYSEGIRIVCTAAVYQRK
jgi:hypothetical protein